MSNYGSLRNFDDTYDREGFDGVESGVVIENHRSSNRRWLSGAALLAAVIGVVLLISSYSGSNVSVPSTNLAASVPEPSDSVLPLASMPRQSTEVEEEDEEASRRTLNPTPVHFPRTHNPTPLALHPTELPTEAPVEHTTRNSRKSVRKSEEDEENVDESGRRTLNPTPVHFPRTHNPTPLALHPTELPTEAPVEHAAPRKSARKSESEESEDSLDESGRRTLNPTPVHFPRTHNPTPLALHPTELPTEAPVEHAAPRKSARKSESEESEDSLDESGRRTLNPTPVHFPRTHNPTPLALHPTELPTEAPVERINNNINRQSKAAQI